MSKMSNMNEPFSALILDEEERLLEGDLEKVTLRKLLIPKLLRECLNQTLLGAVVHDFAEDRKELKIKYYKLN